MAVVHSVSRTYRYRLYPTKTQKIELNRQLSAACQLYNAALEERRYAWKYRHKSISFYDQYAQLKYIRADRTLDIPNFGVAAEVLRRVDRAFVAYFYRIKTNKGKAGYPRFRSRGRYDSITFLKDNKGFKLRNSKHLYAQGIGDIRIKLHRPLEGQIKTVCIKRKADRWFVNFTVIHLEKLLPESIESVGIDVGLTEFATLSDGTEIANPRFYKNSQRKLRIAQRRIARRKRGSESRHKAVRILQRIHEHIHNQRSDFQHKISREIVNQYGTIAVEDLNIKGLAASMLSKSVHDAAWGSFLFKLNYKAEDAGRLFVRVDPRGTSQKCSSCRANVSKSLSDRQHICPNCGLNIGRDLNAARNILRLGMSLAELT